MTARGIGLILVTVGIVLMLISGMGLVSNEQAVDTGSFGDKEKTGISWLPMIGGIILAVGIIVLLSNKKKSFD